MRVPWTSSEPRKIWAQAGQAILTIAMAGPRPGRGPEEGGNLRLAAVPELYYGGGMAGKGLARPKDPRPRGVPVATPKAPRLLVGIATYKERDNLAPLVREIHRHVPFADVLITDDNSPDGTGELADRLARSDPRVRVQHRPGKLGLGTAILSGMRYAMRNN